MQNGMKAPRPEFLDALSNDDLRALSDYLKDHDNEFVGATLGSHYMSIGYINDTALYRFLLAGTRYTERR